MDTKGWFCAAASLESSVGSAAGWRARPVVFWAGAEKNNTDEPNRNQHFWDVFILFWVLIALAEVVGSVPHSCGHDSAFCFSDVEACTFFLFIKEKVKEKKNEICVVNVGTLRRLFLSDWTSTISHIPAWTNCGVRCRHQWLLCAAVTSETTGMLIHCSPPSRRRPRPEPRVRDWAVWRRKLMTDRKAKWKRKGKNREDKRVGKREHKRGGQEGRQAEARYDFLTYKYRRVKLKVKEKWYTRR